MYFILNLSTIVLIFLISSFSTNEDLKKFFPLAVIRCCENVFGLKSIKIKLDDAP